MVRNVMAVASISHDRRRHVVGYGTDIHVISMTTRCVIISLDVVTKLNDEQCGRDGIVFNQRYVATRATQLTEEQKKIGATH